MFADVSPGWSALNAGIAALSGLGGVCVGAWSTARLQKGERRHARLLEQLQQFYSPMVGMKQEIATTKEVSDRLQTIARKARKEYEDTGISVPYPETSSINDLRQYDNKQWWGRVMPLHEQMLAYFTGNTVLVFHTGFLSST
jgi:hypothetical protein